MNHHLRRLSVVTATLLISLSCPLPMVGNSWGSDAVLAQVQTREQRRDEAFRLYKVGVQQDQQGQFREALETFQSVLVIVREIGERQREGATLNYLGGAYSNLGQYPKALEYFQQALAIYEEIGNKAGEGTTLNNLGGVYIYLGQYPKALEYFQQALAIYKEIGNKAGEGTMLNNLGLVYIYLGQYPKALEYFQQALAIYKEIGNKAEKGTTLNNLGGVYANLGQYPKALEYYQQALAITQELGGKVMEGKTLTNIGEVYRNLGQYPQALDYHQQALAITQEISDRATEGISLGNIGLVYTYLGQYPKALEYSQQALAIAQEISDRATEGRALINMGEVYRHLGQYPQALESYQQALAIAQEIGGRAAEGTTLNNIGTVYRHLGQYPQALEYFQQALAITQEIGDRAGEGMALGNVGGVYDNLGQYPQALQYYQQALAITQEIGNKAGEGATLNNIGTVYGNLGQPPQALESYQQALDIAQEIGGREVEGTTLNNIGIVYDKLGQYPQALESYQQALGIHKEIGNKAMEGTILSNVGSAYNTQGKYFQAETTLFAAIEALESLRSRELKDDQRISIFEQQAGSYRVLQQALVAQNKFDQALLIAERSRGRALVALLDSKLSENLSNLPDIKPPLLQEVKQVASEQNATVVQYSIIYEPFKIKGKEEWQQKLYIWVIKPTGEIGFKQVDLEKSLNKSLQDLVINSRDSIGVRSRSIFEVTPTNPQPQNPTEKLQQLHKILIAPIADLLPKDPNERVIFIPQESLFVVPFPALQDEQGKYLIEKHTILTAPAIQVLDLTRKQKHNGQRSVKDVLVVGNPTMPKIQIGELVAKLDPLPGAEKEAIQIAKFFNTEALTGSKATKATVMQLMQKSRIIHLATHGLLHDFKGFGVPGAIALAPSGKANDGIDGLLTAGEIFDMKLQADLVVLSACDTGGGNITGDGVVGLSRSLISAGVPSVLVSLWAVNDNSTAFLMTEFYRNLQQNPDKAVALRQAMLTAMKQYPNPKQWAAFTLIGEAE
ncbi:tetratricopeptide repeat protein [Coleofasciculus sp. FACHB-1120]|uniref:CHAT domain-containing protein n=1 Tax=Coleofasciculus sp. FACHB-1120 TaxID=2692783 RepID=UPI0016832726|nr:tetratricopeptide repeat protein [Coleofasciculus sp. FACHB-1120]MBD2741854.1 tetratricopeptide repeat protein [Coleofasciculus sp. FACHB-1120]